MFAFVCVSLCKYVCVALLGQLDESWWAWTNDTNTEDMQIATARLQSISHEDRQAG